MIRGQFNKEGKLNSLLGINKDTIDGITINISKLVPKEAIVQSLVLINDTK